MPRGELAKLLAQAVRLTEPSLRANMLTTADDKCRLFHVMADPNLADLVSRTKDVLTRDQLDDKTYRTSHWDELATNFNDYEHNTYVHSMEDTLAEDPICMEEFNTVYEFCSNIKPTNKERPPRDGAWVQKTWGELKSLMCKAYSNFSKSGSHDTSDIYDSFWKFCDGDCSILYGFAVNKGLDMSVEFGRSLDRGAVESTGESIGAIGAPKRSPAKRKPEYTDEGTAKAKALQQCVDIKQLESDQKFALEVANSEHVSSNAKHLSNRYIETRLEQMFSSLTQKPPLPPRKKQATDTDRPPCIPSTASSISSTQSLSDCFEQESSISSIDDDDRF